jgi:hypothetical protein
MGIFAQRLLCVSMSLDYFAITFISLPAAQTFEECLLCCVYMSE